MGENKGRLCGFRSKCNLLIHEQENVNKNLDSLKLVFPTKGNVACSNTLQRTECYSWKTPLNVGIFRPVKKLGENSVTSYVRNVYTSR